MKKTLLLLVGLMTINPFLNAQDDPFMFTWAIPDANKTVVLNLQTGTQFSDYAAKVDWGDGSVDSLLGDAPTFSHTYATADTFQISISGEFAGFYSTSVDERMISLDQWGDIEWETTNSMFNGYRRLEYKATDVPNLSNVTDANRMFREAGSRLTDIDSGNWDLSNWDVSNIIFFVDMFASATRFNGDVSTWDMSSAVRLDRMFQRASSFNSDISNWDVSSVTVMSEMFSGATSFNQDLNNWNVSSVTDMKSMFFQASFFNGDISSWDVSAVKNMNRMFAGTRTFNSDISGWNVSSVERFGSMFAGTESFNQDIGGWDISSATSLNAMFTEAHAFDQDLSNWDISNVTNLVSFLGGFLPDFSAGLSVENYDRLLASWSQQNVQPNLSFSAGGSKYSPGSETFKQTLVNNFGWTIFDAGTYEPRLVGEYTFDSVTDTLTDESGNGNIGLLFGASPTLNRDGEQGKAVRFDGSDDYIDFGDSTDFQFGVEDFSFSFWVNFESNSRGYIIHKKTFGNQKNEFRINADNDGGLSLNAFIRDSFIRRTEFISIPITAQEWTHITFIHDADSGMSFYKNGELEIFNSYERPGFRGFNMKGGPLEVGYNSETDGAYYNGSLDDLAVFNYKLSEAQIDTLSETLMPTSSEPINSGIPEVFALNQNYPNPFNPSTTISYTLPKASEVNLAVYNLMGQKVAELVNTKQQSGNHSISFDASTLASGAYIYRLTAGSFTQTRKLTLIK